MQRRIGLRTIEVINEADNMGTSFYVKVNGHPVFMKGANYIPSDNFLPRVSPQQYEKMFADMQSSHFNMIRVWGGGIYENDQFYDLADEKGILVWQDFMFACTLYPSDKNFLEQVKEETAYNIARLRNHPPSRFGAATMKLPWLLRTGGGRMATRIQTHSGRKC